MLKMRLKRTGRRRDPHFAIVVTDATQGPKSNKFVEKLGSYAAKSGEVILDTERAKYWIGVGVQPSDTVYNMLVSKGVVEGKKRNALPKKTAPVVEKAEEAPAEEAPAAESTDETPAEETPAETAEEKTEEVPA